MVGVYWGGGVGRQAGACSINQINLFPKQSYHGVMRLYFYTRPNCPLCDRLEQLIEPHLAALQQRRGEAADLIVRNILDQSAWRETYHQRIPVLMLDERVLLEGGPSEAEVARALTNL